MKDGLNQSLSLETVSETDERVVSVDKVVAKVDSDVSFVSFVHVWFMTIVQVVYRVADIESRAGEKEDVLLESDTGESSGVFDRSVGAVSEKPRDGAKRTFFRATMRKSSEYLASDIRTISQLELGSKIDANEAEIVGVENSRAAVTIATVPTSSDIILDVDSMETSERVKSEAPAEPTKKRGFFSAIFKKSSELLSGTSAATEDVGISDEIVVVHSDSSSGKAGKVNVGTAGGEVQTEVITLQETVKKPVYGVYHSKSDHSHHNHKNHQKHKELPGGSTAKLVTVESVIKTPVEVSVEETGAEKEISRETDVETGILTVAEEPKRSFFEKIVDSIGSAADAVEQQVSGILQIGSDPALETDDKALDGIVSVSQDTELKEELSVLEESENTGGDYVVVENDVVQIQTSENETEFFEGKETQEGEIPGDDDGMKTASGGNLFKSMTDKLKRATVQLKQSTAATTGKSSSVKKPPAVTAATVVKTTKPVTRNAVTSSASKSATASVTSAAPTLTKSVPSSSKQGTVGATTRTAASKTFPSAESGSTSKSTTKSTVLSPKIESRRSMTLGSPSTPRRSTPTPSGPSTPPAEAKIDSVKPASPPSAEKSSDKGKMDARKSSTTLKTWKF
ncbi:hypothetical protein HDU83_000821 [Entophlyctis luteolus]|nr:hypothetical protein HDU83_000821 [Entophlyctis luteolus]KAJ3391008.1 hypothetical protein HDU84_006680 [Entophlyctis sp. JEL0112]